MGRRTSCCSFRRYPTSTHGTLTVGRGDGSRGSTGPPLFDSPSPDSRRRRLNIDRVLALDLTRKLQDANVGRAYRSVISTELGCEAFYTRQDLCFPGVVLHVGTLVSTNLEGARKPLSERGNDDDIERVNSPTKLRQTAPNIVAHVASRRRQIGLRGVHPDQPHRFVSGRLARRSIAKRAWSRLLELPSLRRSPLEAIADPISPVMRAPRTYLANPMVTLNHAVAAALIRGRPIRFGGGRRS